MSMVGKVVIASEYRGMLIEESYSKYDSK